MNRNEKTIERTFYYRIYHSGGRFFVEYPGDPICHSYATLEGAQQAVYYRFG